MPLRKEKTRQSSMRSFADSTTSISDQVEQLHISSSSSQTSSKAQEAGMRAQQLGSEQSWADRFLPELPSSPATPLTATTPASTRMSESIGSPVSNARELPELPESEADNPPNPEDETSPILSRAASMLQQAAGHDLPPTYDDVMSNAHTTTPISPSGAAITAVTRTDTKSISRVASDPPRGYKLQETYKSISGDFTFQDYLELSTSAGSINVTLEPQPGQDETMPAKLRVNAQYGSVKISVSDKYLDRLAKAKTLPRPWDVEIIARTGSITTKLPIGHGSKYLIDAHVGALKCTFYAASVGPTDPISTLTTLTGVGSQKISIESWQDKIPVTQIAATHHAKSHGSLKIDYPKTWRGTVHASSGGFGSVKVSGDKLEHTKYGDREQMSCRGDGEVVEVRCDGHGSVKIDCS